MIVDAIKKAISSLEIHDSTHVPTDFEFQELLDEVIDLVEALEVKLTRSDEQNEKKLNKEGKLRIKLCLLQLESVLRRTLPNVNRLLKMKEVVKLITGRIKLCLTEMLKEFSVNDNYQEIGFSESFISCLEQVTTNAKQMLSQLAKGDKNTRCGLNYATNLVSHALTISQLAADREASEITSSCKQLLGTAKSLNDPMNKDVQLSLKCFVSQLDILKRHVNTAMLHLVLQTMSDPLGVVKDVIKKCIKPKIESKQSILQESPNKSNQCLDEIRKVEDLDDCIAAVDLMSDRLQLIANYSISSINDDSLRVTLESCLASLEFWEGHLVPGLISYYLHPESEENASFARFLVGEWSDAVNSLDLALNGIVDPDNFIQVAVEDLSSILDEVKQLSCDNANSVIMKNFICKSQKVIAVMNSCGDLVSKPIVEAIQKRFRRMKNMALDTRNSELFITSKRKRFDSGHLIAEMEQLLEQIDSATMESRQNHLQPSFVSFILPKHVSAYDGECSSDSVNFSLDSAFNQLDSSVSEDEIGNKNESVKENATEVPQKNDEWDSPLPRDNKERFSCVPYTPGITLYPATPASAARRKKRRYHLEAISSPVGESNC